MVADLKEAFDTANLKRAWRWLNSNSDAYFKAYFRDIYRAYGIAVDANLTDLQKRLKSGRFQPQHATKVYLPKQSGLQRTYTLLTVEDQIVYQALVNVIADRLQPRAKRRHLVEVFGNLYAGKTSTFFYKNWRKCYPKFGQAIRKTYQQGFAYTASFDLTACYDSIDHAVLRHFLEDLGLQKEFSELLCEYLRHWTATMAETRIYQGHGIPQGPLASGLLSEVVLKYFDETRTAKPRAWRYFRYVDDMRFFAKNERDLRLMLVEMDLLSKRIGLFPQSSKIEIHKITNIDDEVKSISNPPEPIGLKSAPNQKSVQKRLNQLTPRFKIQNETRFKFVLGVAVPNSALSKRLLRILQTNPHLYIAIFRYFSRYSEISRALSIGLLAILKTNQLYAAFTAEGLRTLLGRCHPSVLSDLERFAGTLNSPSTNNNGELLAAASAILIQGGKLGYKRISDVISSAEEWWTRAQLLQSVDCSQIGEPSYQALMNHFIKDPSGDVSVVAAELILEHSLQVIVPIDDINPTAQTTLRESGIINVRRGGPCPISAAMQHLFGPAVKDIKWKTILGNRYSSVAMKAARLKSYADTNATAWVNLIDTVHDFVLERLFSHDTSIGSYAGLGKIGSHLGAPTSGFAKTYPRVFAALKKVHDKRYQSELSHPKVRSTKRNTTVIEYGFVRQVKPALRRAYLEIWNKW